MLSSAHTVTSINLVFSWTADNENSIIFVFVSEDWLLFRDKDIKVIFLKWLY